MYLALLMAYRPSPKNYWIQRFKCSSSGDDSISRSMVGHWRGVENTFGCDRRVIPSLHQHPGQHPLLRGQRIDRNGGRIRAALNFALLESRSAWCTSFHSSRTTLRFRYHLSVKGNLYRRPLRIYVPSSPSPFLTIVLACIMP